MPLLFLCVILLNWTNLSTKYGQILYAESVMCRTSVWNWVNLIRCWLPSHCYFHNLLLNILICCVRHAENPFAFSRCLFHCLNPHAGLSGPGNFPGGPADCFFPPLCWCVPGMCRLLHWLLFWAFSSVLFFQAVDLASPYFWLAYIFLWKLDPIASIWASCLALWKSTGACTPINSFLWGKASTCPTKGKWKLQPDSDWVGKWKEVGVEWNWWVWQ